MSTLSLFLKSNKKKRENQFYAATKSLCDEKGKPLLWEFAPIDTRENQLLSEECTKELPSDNPCVFRTKTDYTAYTRKMICRCCVFPDLLDKDLQESYGVQNPEDLLLQMVDNPGEYGDLVEFIQRLNGFTPLSEKVGAAKN